MVPRFTCLPLRSSARYLHAPTRLDFTTLVLTTFTGCGCTFGYGSVIYPRAAHHFGSLPHRAARTGCALCVCICTTPLHAVGCAVLLVWFFTGSRFAMLVTTPVLGSGWLRTYTHTATRTRLHAHTRAVTPAAPARGSHTVTWFYSSATVSSDSCHTATSRWLVDLRVTLHTFYGYPHGYGYGYAYTRLVYLWTTHHTLRCYGYYGLPDSYGCRGWLVRLPFTRYGYGLRLLLVTLVTFTHTLLRFAFPPPLRFAVRLPLFVRFTPHTRVCVTHTHTHGLLHTLALRTHLPLTTTVTVLRLPTFPGSSPVAFVVTRLRFTVCAVGWPTFTRCAHAVTLDYILRFCGYSSARTLRLDYTYTRYVWLHGLPLRVYVPRFFTLRGFCCITVWITAVGSTLPLLPGSFAVRYLCCAYSSTTTGSPHLYRTCGSCTRSTCVCVCGSTVLFYRYVLRLRFTLVTVADLPRFCSLLRLRLILQFAFGCYVHVYTRLRFGFCWLHVAFALFAI